MSRLRTSLVTAMNYTKEEIKKGASLDEAAHTAALRFNEDEAEIYNKVKNHLEREARKTGKVGRPSKKYREENSIQPITNVNNNKKKKNNKSSNKNVADTIKEEINSKDNITKNPYTFNGEINIKIYGQESKLNVLIPTNTSDYTKACDYVLNKLYENNILTYISSKDLERCLKNE